MGKYCYVCLVLSSGLHFCDLKKNYFYRIICYYKICRGFQVQLSWCNSLNWLIMQILFHPWLKYLKFMAFSVSKLTPCCHRWSLFNCISKLQRTVGYVWSQYLFKTILQSCSVKDYILLFKV